MRPSKLLDPADRQRLEAACFEALKMTRGELALVVVGASDAYAGAGWRLGLLLALVASFGLAAFVPDAALADLLAAQGAALATGHALARFDPVRRRLVSSTLAEQSVERRAARAFAESGLHHHPDRAGVLLFVSLLERRVLVLADTGLEARLPGSEPWQDLVEPMIDALREGRAADGLMQAVERCGVLLALHLPGVGGRVGAQRAGVVLED